MDRTIIGGEIEFLDKGRAVVHSIDEVYSAGSTEEQDALEDMFYNSGVDWIVVETYFGEIEVTRDCLLALLGKISGKRAKKNSKTK